MGAGVPSALRYQQRCYSRLTLRGTNSTRLDDTLPRSRVGRIAWRSWDWCAKRDARSRRFRGNRIFTPPSFETDDNFEARHKKEWSYRRARVARAATDLEKVTSDLETEERSDKRSRKACKLVAHRIPWKSRKSGVPLIAEAGHCDASVCAARTKLRDCTHACPVIRDTPRDVLLTLRWAAAGGNKLSTTRISSFIYDAMKWVQNIPIFFVTRSIFTATTLRIYCSCV